MDSKQLLNLYQKLIESQSSENPLMNMRQIISVCSNKSLSAQMIATIRYSPEYLSLLTNEKLFNSTYESLLCLYNREKGLKFNRKNLSSEFQEWIFQRMFTMEEKSLIQEMVAEQYGGNKRRGNYLQKMNKHNFEPQNQFDANKKQKHLFCEMLQLIFCEQDITKRKATSNKNKQQTKKHEECEFSVGKLLGMIL